MTPSLFCSPSIMLFGSFGLFSVNQYFEHLSPSFRKHAWADSFALSSFSLPILFRELLRNRNSSLAFILFSVVALLEENPLLWVSMSFLRPFTSLFAFFFSSSITLMAFSLMSSLTFFHLVCGFCPLLLSFVISPMFLNSDSFIVYCDTHLS